MDPDETARVRRLIWIHAGCKRTRSTVYSWMSHPGVIDDRRALEIPYRMEQFAALMWRVLEEDTSMRGDRLTMLDSGRYAFPPVTFIGPAGETRFDAGASWDELGGVQTVQPPLPLTQPSDSLSSSIQNLNHLCTTEEDNWQARFIPVIEIEEESTRLSPLFSMAYGGGENEVKEFVEEAGSDDDDSNEEFLAEEYDLDELEE